MKRKYRGIPYEIVGDTVHFIYNNEPHVVKLEWGESASKTIDKYIRRLNQDNQDKKETVLVYSNNRFGNWWKSCIMGEIKVTKEDGEIYLHMRYKELYLKVECYKHPFQLAAAILRGTDDFIRKSFKQVEEFQSKGWKAGKDYTISPKGVLPIGN